jgi:hypothetical protein
MSNYCMFLSRARNHAGYDLHRNADAPSGHYYMGPNNVRIVPQHDCAYGCESCECGEERAHRTKKFWGVYLANPADRWLIVRSVKRQWRRIDADIKTYGPADHHQDEEGLVFKEQYARSDRRSNEHSAGRASHGKAKAFKNVDVAPKFYPVLSSLGRLVLVETAG